MKITILFLVQILFFGSNILFAQQNMGKFLVQFKDKANNTFSIAKPEEFLSKRSINRRTKQGIKITAHDLPPTKLYIDELIKTGAILWYKSRWYNGALVLADSATILKIRALPFVKGLENDGPLNLTGSGGFRKQTKFDIKIDSINYGNGVNQAKMLGTHHLQNAGFKGKGMMIAVLDDGFNRVDKDIYMKHLFDEKRVISTFDFVLNKADVYNIGGHGNVVLSTMAANTDGKFVGTAPDASYVLLRTEDAPTEKIIEEANWLFAAEYADSVGVDLINSSLGYFDFDYTQYNHSKSDLNGDKTLCTRAADWAAATGILVCISAGNSGNGGIGAPADADSVLAIGSVDRNTLKSNFSSIGPTSDGRIKPDLVAMGSASTVSAVNGSTGETILFTSSGTSFSSPIFTGFAACFWQAYPQLKVMEVQSQLKKIGSQADKPDNLLGWGIPQFGKIVILANESELNSAFRIYPNPSAEFLTISIPTSWNNQLFEMKISDISGETIRNESKLIGNQKVNLANFASGLYFGKLINNEQILTFKFLKQE